MAQKREKEETELKVPETISLCTQTITVSNTDDKTHASLSSITSDLKFSGFNESRSTSARSPESSDLITTPPEKNSGGDNDRRSLKTPIDAANRRSRSPESSDLVSNDLRLVKTAMEENRCSGTEFRRGRLTESSDLVSDSPPPERNAGENDRRSVKRPRETATATATANRCSGVECRRKVGLMGFRCRCGEVFCFEHRYSDRHECSYDYKAAGREAIARENPVVRAAKIVKV